MLTFHRVLPAALAIAATGFLLTGCTGISGTAHSATDTSSAAAPTAPASTSGASASSPTSTPSPAATAHSTPAVTSTPGPDGVSGGGGSISPGASSTALARCTVSQLKGSIADGGGTTTTSYNVAIILRNVSAKACTLQGWPGVSFVGNGNGTQIGRSAVLDRSTTHPALTVKPAGEVQSIVKIKQDTAWNSATCEPRTTDGFRVYPPGSTQSLFIGASGATYEACANTAIQQLTASALNSF